MNEVTQLNTKDGDGEDSDNLTYVVNIEQADNGWLVFVVDEFEEHRMVFEFDNGKEMMSYISEKLGV